jgi:hypothetical protein
MCGAIQIRSSFDRRRIRRPKTDHCAADLLQQYFLLNERFASPAAPL